MYEEEYATLSVDMPKILTNIWKIMMKVKNCHIFNVGM